MTRTTSASSATPTDMPAAKGSLTPNDWAMAALRSLARGGVAALSIGALARELGATRGSFYWHFKDRAAVLTAALELWERLATAEFIAALESEPDPRERLRRLLHDAITLDPVPGLEPSITAHAAHPAVAPVLRRITSARIDYLTRCYRALGDTPAVARRRAVTAYSAYLGWLNLRQIAPELVPEVGTTGRVAKAALRHLIDELVADSCDDRDRQATSTEGAAQIRAGSARRRTR